MATVHKTHWGPHWRHKAALARRDPAADQLHRDRVTALVVVGIMAVVFAVIITLAVLGSATAGSQMIDPWMMP